MKNLTHVRKHSRSVSAMSPKGRTRIYVPELRSSQYGPYYSQTAGEDLQPGDVVILNDNDLNEKVKQWPRGSPMLPAFTVSVHDDVDASTRYVGSATHDDQKGYLIATFTRPIRKGKRFFISPTKRGMATVKSGFWSGR